MVELTEFCGGVIWATRRNVLFIAFIGKCFSAGDESDHGSDGCYARKLKRRFDAGHETS